jgi:hypothetical protein
MKLERAGLFVVLFGLAVQAVAVLAQAPAPAAASRPAATAPAVDVNRLPVDLWRIGRQLQQAHRDTEERDGLNLRYQIEVFGRAPQLQLFTPEDNLRYGPVPYGAPTHQEIINHITPKEFSSPVMDFNALMRWLAEKSKK